jgi:2-methylcitrate dehydratase PrpD
VFGAAAACGKLLGLDAQQMAWALGIAATQAAGITGGHGSMSKSYNMGHAARSGIAAALLAAQGFTSADGALETARGFYHLFAEHPDPSQVVAGLGQGWELMGVSYKPYPCGIVAHPVIDACLELLEDPGVDAAAVQRVELRAHPLVAMLMAIAAPTTALQAKLSVHHCVATALLYGRVGVAEFGDACVNDPAVVALRKRVTLQVDDTVDKAASDVTLVLNDGASLRKLVPHASGSLERPLSDAAIEAKFRALAAWGSPQIDASALVDLVWSLDRAPDAGALARACVPARTG